MPTTEKMKSYPLGHNDKCYDTSFKGSQSLRLEERKRQNGFGLNQTV